MGFRARYLGTIVAWIGWAAMTGDIEAQSAAPPLYDDLGDLHRPISTGVPVAQAYFDQGLRLYYAFNHEEAIASFREAQRLDPDCAMCWWGEALAWGPNINLPMDHQAGTLAEAAIGRAGSLMPTGSEKEDRMIAALSRRYSSPPPTNRVALDSAYADEMHDLAERFPDDDDIAVLYGESVMDLSPWDYWTVDGRLRTGMDDALEQFERVLSRNPKHPGACHFFIHAVEKEQPERAVPCAEGLAERMPGAGHLVHMPGHIYIRVGRYLDAIQANEHAIHADESWIQDRRPASGFYTAGYYPHNYDFLAFAAVMAGREDQAIEASDRVADLIWDTALHDPELTFAQHYSMRALLIRTRFERWDEILAVPDPGETLPHARALWHYARGRAFVGSGDVERARVELQQLGTVATDPRLEAARLEFNASRDILGIAEGVLEARIAEAEGRPGEAIERMDEAVRIEDGLLYGEPPEWSVPVRQELGEILLNAGRETEAEAVFRADLDRFPNNVWSLEGLERSLSR